MRWVSVVFEFWLIISGPSTTSSLLTEEHFIEQGVKPQNIKCYLFDSSILTVIRRDGFESSKDQILYFGLASGKLPTVTLILRDLTGKYVWSVQSNYLSPIADGEGTSHLPVFLLYAVRWEEYSGKSTNVFQVRTPENL